MTKYEKDGTQKLNAEHLKNLHTQRKNLVRLNNGYLNKNKIHIDRGYVIKPFLIDDDLEKKKKQPKFVKNMIMTKEIKMEEFYSDDSFMKTCQKGQMIERIVKSKEPECRFLHHMNPYLKLGPFKEEMKSERPYAGTT